MAISDKIQSPLELCDESTGFIFDAPPQSLGDPEDPEDLDGADHADVGIEARRWLLGRECGTEKLGKSWQSMG